MTRRVSYALLALFLLTLPLAAAPTKRRAVTPGAGRCVYGTLDADAFVFPLAIDATHVYYIDDFDLTLYRVPKEGGPRLMLASLRSVLVTSMVMDATDVYLATIPDTFTSTPPPGSISVVSKQGGTRRTVASNVIVPTSLEVDATHVYWVSAGTINFETETILADGKIERIRKDGTGREALAQSLSGPVSLVLDANDVFFSESGVGTGNSSRGVRRVAKSGGSVTQVQSTHVADVITQSTTDIYFYGASGDFQQSGIFRVPKGGGSVQLVAADDFFAIGGGPKVFNEFVYFVAFDLGDFADTLYRVPLTGGTPVAVHSDIWNDYDFELDECAVYYGNVNGFLMKAPR